MDGMQIQPFPPPIRTSGPSFYTNTQAGRRSHGHSSHNKQFNYFFFQECLQIKGASTHKAHLRYLGRLQFRSTIWWKHFCTRVLQSTQKRWSRTRHCRLHLCLDTREISVAKTRNSVTYSSCPHPRLPFNKAVWIVSDCFWITERIHSERPSFMIRCTLTSGRSCLFCCN